MHSLGGVTKNFTQHSAALANSIAYTILIRSLSSPSGSEKGKGETRFPQASNSSAFRTSVVKNLICSKKLSATRTTNFDELGNYASPRASKHSHSLTVCTPLAKDVALPEL